MTNIVHLADCMDFMSQLPDNHFDLCVADPWYGIGMMKDDTTGFAKKRFSSLERIGVGADEFQDEAPPKEHFDEIRRISKEQIIWGGNYFLDYLGNCRAPIIWDKGTGANYFADGEMAWTSFTRGCLRIFKHKWCGCFKASEKTSKTIHPCQKPIELYRWTFKKFYRPGMRVFSPYVGSGSDRIAAHEMGIHFEGCEISPIHWRNQEVRFEEYFKQPLLLTPEQIQEEYLQEVQ